MNPYSYFFERSARQNFAYVQNHNYDEVLKAVVPNVTHHFAGDHALGGTRHDAKALRMWFERLGRILPNLQFEIKNIWVKGMPWNTTVIVQWVATTTLRNGDPYVNPGVHIINLRWGKVIMLSREPAEISTAPPWRGNQHTRLDSGIGHIHFLSVFGIGKSRAQQHGCRMPAQNYFDDARIRTVRQLVQELRTT